MFENIFSGTLGHQFIPRIFFSQANLDEFSINIVCLNDHKDVDKR